MIYYEVVGGLCNRMRTIASAYRFSQDLKQELVIIWRVNSECNCRFERLFTLNVQSGVRFMQWRESGIYARRDKAHKRRLDKIKGACDIVYEKDPCFLDKREILKEAKGKNIYLRSYSYWYKTEDPFAIFVLRNSIKKAVEKLKRECGEHSCGVHVRRTDNVISIEKSPTAAFVEKMKIELEENPSVKFYVASDDESEKNYFREIFGAEKIVVNPHAVLCRNMSVGIVDAAIDLYVLSETEKILGSVWSSFSEVASQIRGIPLICCGESCHNTESDVSDWP